LTASVTIQTFSINDNKYTVIKDIDIKKKLRQYVYRLAKQDQQGNKSEVGNIKGLEYQTQNYLHRVKLDNDPRHSISDSRAFLKFIESFEIDLRNRGVDIISTVPFLSLMDMAYKNGYRTTIPGLDLFIINNITNKFSINLALVPMKKKLDNSVHTE